MITSLEIVVGRPDVLRRCRLGAKEGLALLRNRSNIILDLPVSPRVAWSMSLQGHDSDAARTLRPTPADELSSFPNRHSGRFHPRSPYPNKRQRLRNLAKPRLAPKAQRPTAPNQHKNAAEKEPQKNVNPDSVLLQELPLHARAPSLSAKSGKSCPCDRSEKWCAPRRSTSCHTCFSQPRRHRPRAPNGPRRRRGGRRDRALP